MLPTGSSVILRISYYTLATKLTLEARPLVSYLDLHGETQSRPNPRASFSKWPLSMESVVLVRVSLL